METKEKLVESDQMHFNRELTEVMLQVLERSEEQKLAQKKHNRLLRVCAWGCVGIFLVVLVCAVLLMPQVLSNLGDAQGVMQSLDPDKISRLVDSAQTLADSAQTFIAELEVLMADVGQAVKNLEKIDIQKLNEAIENLNQTVKPLADFFSILR